MAASTPTPIAIELHQLGHEFLEGKPVLKGISSEIKAGMHAVINGQNGSGKSTLGKILSGQLTSSEGTIVWNQNDAELPQQELLLEASFTGPSTSLHPQLSIEEILQFHGTFRNWRQGANPVASLHAAGLQSHMHVRFAELSSGMKQRVLLTVSLCTASGLIVLDEPCANLDRAGIDWYREQLVDLPAQTTLVICTNDRQEDYIQADVTLSL